MASEHVIQGVDIVRSLYKLLDFMNDLAHQFHIPSYKTVFMKL